MSKILHLDFETSSKSDIKSVGTYRYCADPSTEVLCIGYAFDDEPVKVEVRMPNKVRRHIREGGLVYAHNAAMEEQILYHVFGIDNVNMRCTSAVASYNALPASLEAVAEHLNLEMKKDKDGAKVLRKYYRVPLDEIPYSDLDIIKSYCKRDVEVEREIHRRLGDLPERELKVWKLDQKMNCRGISIDEDLARRSIEMVNRSANELSDTLMRLTGGLVERPTMAKRIIDWLSTKGIQTDTLSLDYVKDMLDGDLQDDVREVLLCRQRGGGSSTGKFKRALDMVNDDGRIRGSLRYHGATTGRWAGSGLQPQNLPRGTVADTDTLADYILSGQIEDIKRMAGNVFDGAKSAVRAMLRASEDRVLYVVDYSSIEARVLAWYAGQQNLVEAFRTGEDIYCLFASKVFGEEVTKSDKKKRMVGKQAVLGLGYGMGANKFQATLKLSGIEVSLDFAQGVVDTYRNEYPDIRQLWWDLDSGAVQAVQRGESEDGKWYTEGGALHFTLPSGRVIRYQSCSLFTNRFDRPAVKYKRPLGKNFVLSDSYGGKWCENICQAIARDVMVDSMLELDKKGHRLLLTVHDEVIIEGSSKNPELTLKQIESIMESEREWCVGLPTAVEGFFSYRFKK